MHFLIGEDSGMLAWHQTECGAEIIAIHSLPESWGTGLGHAMLTYALQKIGDQPAFLWVFKKIFALAGSTKSTAFAGMVRNVSASLMMHLKCGM